MSAEDPYAPFEATCINGDITMTCRYYNGLTRSPVHARVVLSPDQTQILIDELVKSLLEGKKHATKKPSFIPDELLEEEEE